MPRRRRHRRHPGHNHAAIIALGAECGHSLYRGSICGKGYRACAATRTSDDGRCRQIAREAAAKRVEIEPFHFSPRYVGEEQNLLEEVMTAFAQTS
jgi:hypothetical protein